MKDIRAAAGENRFEEFRKEWLDVYKKNRNRSEA
jgi:queuine/archaeosine tRNA-ribosyltransferase